MYCFLPAENVQVYLELLGDEERRRELGCGDGITGTILFLVAQWISASDCKKATF